ncbi:MAG TPA: hypothetical protein VFH58_13495, partial [Acidimicrobiales bacterium]|nr:hypothetical protein [Acidimicrobiales bacterium]
MNRVQVGFFSLSASLGPDSDPSYLEWHQLDHMPEQYQIPGLLHGQRWMSSPACRAARVTSGDWGRVDHVVLYLMGEPVEETLDRFMRLGGALRDAGRYPVVLPSVFAGTAAFGGGAAAPAALVSDEVVPWRPNRGIYLVVEDSGADHPYDDRSYDDHPNDA